MTLHFAKGPPAFATALVLACIALFSPVPALAYEYNQMQYQTACASCHVLVGYIPGSSYIVPGMGLDRMQNCLTCHPGRFYQAGADTFPFTVVDRGYDPAWPYAISMRLFLFDASADPAAGTLTFTAALFSSGGEQADANPNCVRFSCAAASPGYRLVGEYSKVGDPAVSGSFAREDLSTYRRETLAWDCSALPAGRYEVKLTPCFGAEPGIPFVLEFDWTGPPSRPPVLDPVGDRTVLEGQTLAITLTAGDPDAGQTLTFSAANLPPGAAFDPAVATFTWTPGYDQSGTYPGVEFTVMDNGSPISLDVEVITITVGNVNRAPMVTVPGPRSVVEYDLLAFIVTAADPDDDPFSLYAGALPAGASFDPATGSFSWSPDGTQAGVYPVAFYAVDQGVPPLTAQADVVITVGETTSPGGLLQKLIPRIIADDFPTEVENSYMANLKKVEVFVQEGRLGAAINQLRSFVQKAGQDIEKGPIPAGEGQILIMMANDIIALLGG